MSILAAVLYESAPHLHLHLLNSDGSRLHAFRMRDDRICDVTHRVRFNFANGSRLERAPPTRIGSFSGRAVGGSWVQTTVRRRACEERPAGDSPKEWLELLEAVVYAPAEAERGHTWNTQRRRSGQVRRADTPSVNMLCDRVAARPAESHLVTHFLLAHVRVYGAQKEMVRWRIASSIGPCGCGTQRTDGRDGSWVKPAS
jgi:hypothetical protein|eukprot:4082337-Prymnesium_polylepis.2